MGKINDFLNPDEPKGYEKINGFYGCKHCDENLDHAWWDAQRLILFWVCSKNHRTEQQLV